jgi:hypothetical protein
MTVRTRRTLVRTVTGTVLALASWWIRPSAAPGQLSCSDWRFCGLCGCRCTCRGGSDTACPSGSTPGAPGGPAVAMPAAASGSFSTATAVDHCAPASQNAPTLSMGAPAAVPVHGTARNRTGVPADRVPSVPRRSSRHAAECGEKLALRPSRPSPVPPSKRCPSDRPRRANANHPARDTGILAVCPFGSCLQPAARAV